MKLSILATISISLCVALSDRPLLATSLPCTQAIQKAKAQLGSVKSLKIYPIPAVYGRHPSGRSMAVSIGLTAERAMNNSALQLRISKNITNKCRNVGLVSFALDETDWVNIYGSIAGQIKPFVCKEAGEKLRWGEQTCL